MSNNQLLHWDFSSNNDKICLSFSGELTRFTLSSVLKERHHFFAKIKNNSSIILWDFSELYRIDSAGFAFLCELLHQGESLSKNQMLINSPKQFLTLADLFGLSNWLSAFLPQMGK